MSLNFIDFINNKIKNFGFKKSNRSLMASVKNGKPNANHPNACLARRSVLKDLS
jgi:hypothetical protein